MTRLLRRLAAGGLLTFCLVGFLDKLPIAIQMKLFTIAMLGSVLTGRNVHVSNGTFLIAVLFAALTVFVTFIAAALSWVGALEGRAIAGSWLRRLLPAAAFLACLALFTAAFRGATFTASEDPFSTPLGPFALSYALAAVVAGILWRSPLLVFPSLLLSVALGMALSPPLLSLYLPMPPEAGGARVAALLRLGGLAWLTGLLAGTTAWLLVRRIVPVDSSTPAVAPRRLWRSIGVVQWREVLRARGREIAAAAAVAVVLLVVAFELRGLWWPEPASPWIGAQAFADASLAPLFEPDRPLRASSFFETKDDEAMYVADLRDAAPRGYAQHYLELLRARGVFIRVSAGSAHAPRPIESYDFTVLAKGADSGGAWSLRYLRFRDERPEMPEGSFWWPIERWRPYPNPVQLRGHALWVRLGHVRHAMWEETWPLPVRDEIEGPELPLPRFPGAIVRDWGPDAEDRAFVAPSFPLDVHRLYVVRGATAEEVVAHYERALRAFGVTPGPDRRVGHRLEWSGKEPVQGVVHVAVTVGTPGLIWGHPLAQPEESEIAEQLFPLKELVEVGVSVRFARQEEALAFWPDADRRRRQLLLAADEGKPARAATPAPIAPPIALLSCGWFTDALQLLRETLHEPVRLVAPSQVSVGLLAEHRALVIPTGGLSGLGARADFVARLGQFVRAGGVVVTFSQGQGHDYDALPVPSGERLRAIGSDADRSVYARGVRVDQAHPVLASLAEGIATINVDGAFEEVPGSARVLLRKARSDFAALVVYRVGHGWVVVSSIFDDCLSCQRPGPGRPDVVGDILAWAREPAELPWHSPGSGLVLSVPVANRGQSASAAVVLRLLSPMRDLVLAETTLPSLTEPRRDSEVRWALHVPADAPRGIHHVSYTLCDADGRVVQPAVESLAARVVVGGPVSPPEPTSDLSVSVVVPQGLRVKVGAPLRVEYRLENRLDRERRLRLYVNTTGQPPTLVGEEVLAPRGRIAGALEIRPRNGDRGVWLQVFEVNGTPKGRPGIIIPSETAAFQLVEGVGIRVGSDP